LVKYWHWRIAAMSLQGNRFARVDKNHSLESLQKCALSADIVLPLWEPRLGGWLPAVLLSPSFCVLMTSDKYLPASWDEAFELAGRHCRSLDNPNQAAFYTSGRLSNEGLQGITVEDSMSMVHLSNGMKRPCSPHLRTESAIIAGIAKASLPKTATPWEEYAADYNRLRDKMAEAIEGFESFNRRVRQPLMPELNVLCPIGDYSAQSDQPLMKHVVVEIKPSKTAAVVSEAA
jgi:hypothetical protein